ncbi:MAG: flagellar hook-associated protein FlgL [Peptococcaceae bacterium]|nr:flagellar hook-associated protein FlgL [Peptococcaceae bacterium]
MRVTNRYIANSLVSNIQQNLSRLARTQEELSTGKCMLRPSDKPNRVSPLLSVKASISYLEQYERNLDDGLSYLYLGDSVMQTLCDLLNQAGEMAVQGANSTYAREDMAALGEQVEKMIDQVVDLANSSVGGRFIFAGTKDNAAPFRREGDKIIYSGDLNGIYREVLTGDQYRIDAPGITTGSRVVTVNSASAGMPVVTQRQADLTVTGIITVTCTAPGVYTITDPPTKLDGVTADPSLISDGYTVAGDVITINGPAAGLRDLQIDMTGAAAGDQYQIVIDNQLGVFGHGEETVNGSGQIEYVVYDASSPNNSVDRGIFDCLFELRDRLNAGDHAGVDDSIAEVQEKLNQLLQRRVGVGARTRHFEALKEQLNDQEIKLKDHEQKLEGADMYKLSINLSQEQVVYQASLASGAGIMQISLLNFLK